MNFFFSTMLFFFVLQPKIELTSSFKLCWKEKLKVVYLLIRGLTKSYLEISNVIFKSKCIQTFCELLFNRKKAKIVRVEKSRALRRPLNTLRHFIRKNYTFNLFEILLEHIHPLTNYLKIMHLYLGTGTLKIFFLKLIKRKFVQIAENILNLFFKFRYIHADSEYIYRIYKHSI